MMHDQALFPIFGWGLGTRLGQIAGVETTIGVNRYVGNIYQLPKIPRLSQDVHHAPISLSEYRQYAKDTQTIPCILLMAGKNLVPTSGKFRHIP